MRFWNHCLHIAGKQASCGFSDAHYVKCWFVIFTADVTLLEVKSTVNPHVTHADYATELGHDPQWNVSPCVTFSLSFWADLNLILHLAYTTGTSPTALIVFYTVTLGAYLLPLWKDVCCAPTRFIMGRNLGRWHKPLKCLVCISPSVRF